jgi:hypothetical protein
MNNSRPSAVLFALGATLGTALDGIHSHFGATSYTHPVFWRAAWWVPLLFGAAFTIGMIRPLVDRNRVRPTWGRIGAAFACFIAAYWASVLPFGWPVIVTILFALFLLSWWVNDRAPIQLAIAAAAAIGGSTVESILVGRGLFVHHQVFAFGVPAWLPFLYMAASVPLCLLAKRLVAPRG